MSLWKVPTSWTITGTDRRADLISHLFINKNHGLFFGAAFFYEFSLV